jgi:hypothetical protein
MADVHQPNMRQHQVTGWTGWVAFAGFLMAISGIFHIILGIGGTLSSDWYLYGSGDIYWFDASAWGWSMIAGGALLLLSAGLLMAGNMLGRVIAVLIALASLVANLALLPATPVWSIIAITLNIVLIYAVMAHGSEMKHLDETDYDTR